MISLPLLAQFSEYAALIIAAAIVVVGLFVIGIRDLGRFSLKRAWAISGVCFDESIRRRVLWITPLAILGVIIVSQLTRPFDEQDAIRQTTKFSVFATGMLVAIVTIILAATNLPKEIENRVIYTIVTKPTTRLEIILGKVIGFARVSAAILLIMGIFSWGYLHVRAWSLQQGIRTVLEAENSGLSTVNRSTLEHYLEFGLLTAKSYEWADNLSVFARPPEDGVVWMPGDGEGTVLVRFDHPPEAFVPPGLQSVAEGAAVAIMLNVGYETGADQPVQIDLLSELGIPSTQPMQGLPTPMLRPRPRVNVDVIGPGGVPIFNASQFPENNTLTLSSADGSEAIVLPLSPEQTLRLSNVRPFFVSVTGITRGAQYRIARPEKPEESPVTLRVVNLHNGNHKTLTPSPGGEANTFIAFQGREGTFGQQLRGGPVNTAPMAIYSFRNAEPSIVNDGEVPFEMRIGIERSQADEFEDDNFTTLEIRVRDSATGQESEPRLVRVESNRNVYFNLPAEHLSSGNFDLVVRNTTNGHWIGLLPRSIQMVTGNSPFAWNLLKSLAVLWLMSILIVIVAIFCSTFLSWPIAIVLSVVILLGHWGVQQVGDPGSSLGNQVANDLFPRGAAQARVVSSTVNALNSFMQTIGSVLPDISRFSATEELERGVSVPASRLTDAGKVAFGFGIPLMVLAYIFLKNKEVAP